MSKIISFLFFVLFVTNYSLSQTLIINEISQGPSGNKEYVELLVIPGNIPYNCTNYCQDLRNWILDDNNGYFSGGATSGVGIANGALRFKNDPFWQCVPIGTIILIYNDLDLNADIPSNDFSTVDGNCRLIIPVSSTLFEHQTVSPTTTSMTYPSTGWTSGGLWDPIAMANGGDSFQIYTATNQTIPVHGVSWSNNNSNSIIYFPTSSATDVVFYFGNSVDNNPSNQSNWFSGTCTAPNNQTPGLPNNLANENYISSLTNNCAGPLVALINASTDASSCQCNGSATVNATGSIPGYTYAWYNSSNISLGQATATASNLCAGNYYCIVNSSINCSDTAFVTINSPTNTILPDFNPISPICIGGVINLPTTSLNGIIGSWSPSINNNQTTTYTFTPDLGQCASTATATVTVNPILDPQFDIWGPYCQGDILAQVILPETSLNGITGSWNPQMVSTSSAGTSTYTFTPNSSECANAYNLEIIVNPLPVINAGNNITICEGASITLSASGGLQYVWTNSISNGTQFIPAATATYYVTGTDANGCEATDSITVLVLSNPLAAFTPSVSSGQAPLNVQFVNTSSNASSYFWNFGNGNSLSTTNLNPVNSSFSNPQIYTVWLTASNGFCEDSTFQIITVNNQGDPEILIPNVFTPNGDGVNISYGIISKNAISQEAIILNRWGELMVELNTLNMMWDGKTSNGSDATPGVYFIKYKVVGLNGKKLTGQTFFHLIR